MGLTYFCLGMGISQWETRLPTELDQEAMDTHIPGHVPIAAIHGTECVFAPK